MLIKPLFILPLLLSSPLLLTTVSRVDATDKDRLDNYSDWGINRGDKKGNQYSELAYIHAANVHKLEPAWEYHAGDANERSNMHSNPIIIDGLMYFTTSTLRAVALDAGTGEEVWVFKAEEHNDKNTLFRGRSRGIVYWESGDDKRIFHSVKDRVYALDAKTGELIRSFGEDGHLDLRKNLGMDPNKASIEVTNPGIIFKNFLIVVSRVPEGYESTPGDIRAYDTVTGEFKWTFHTIPHEGEFGYDTWNFVEGESFCLYWLSLF
jgi:quinoprotein glucose dehydrogenase